jgi:hypothetical protein
VVVHGGCTFATTVKVGKRDGGKGEVDLSLSLSLYIYICILSLYIYPSPSLPLQQHVLKSIVLQIT